MSCKKEVRTVHEENKNSFTAQMGSQRLQMLAHKSRHDLLSRRLPHGANMARIPKYGKLHPGMATSRQARGACLQQRKVAQYLGVFRLDAQRVKVALNGLPIVMVRAIH